MLVHDGTQRRAGDGAHMIDLLAHLLHQRSEHAHDRRLGDADGSLRDGEHAIELRHGDLANPAADIATVVDAVVVHGDVEQRVKERAQQRCVTASGAGCSHLRDHIAQRQYRVPARLCVAHVLGGLPRADA